MLKRSPEEPRLRQSLGSMLISNQLVHSPKVFALSAKPLAFPFPQISRFSNVLNVVKAVGQLALFKKLRKNHFLLQSGFFPKNLAWNFPNLILDLMNTNTHSKTWTSLKPSDYQDILPVILENADRHFSCAHILAKNDQPQNAIAHLILGSEELVKSFWCLLMSRKVNLKKLPWFTKVFYNHKVRHDLLKDFFSLYLFFFSTALPARNKGDGILKSIQVIITRTINAYGNYTWWDKADELKQQVFYVDYSDGIICPSAKNQSDYNSALNHITLFKEGIGKLTHKIQGMSDVELQTMIDEFQFFEIDKLRQEAYKKEK